jgi:glycerol-3-phosphate acyltransferase PlsY
VKLLQGIDVRDYGSGNTGATNVFRVGGPKAAVITAIGDVGKGVLAVTIARLLVKEAIWGIEPKTILLLCGLMVIAGHNWSVFLNFEGGKGVATTAGVIFILMPYLIWVLVLVWFPVVLLTRYVSLASMMAGLSVPIVMLVRGEPLNYLLFGFLVAIFILFRHRANIQRLLAGTESRIDWLRRDKAKKRVR